MLDYKILKAEKSVNDLKNIYGNACRLRDERKCKFAMIGLNNVIKTMAELMYLEKVIDCLDEAIQTDESETGVLSLHAIKSEIVPGAKEMLDYISLEYRDDFSDECEVLKKFVDEIQYQVITNKLFEQI